ncbi:MAG: tetratricopeptide repeat protein [Balneola sp.]
MRTVSILLCIAYLIAGCQQTSNYESSNPVASFPDTESHPGFQDYQLAQIYLDDADYDSARFYGFRAMISAENGPDLMIKGKIQMLLADAHYFQSDYEEARTFADEALEIANELPSDSLKADALHRIGNIYRRQGYYSQATQYMFEAIKLAETLEHPLLLAMVYEDLANVYDHDAEYEFAREYYLKAKTIYEELNDVGNIAGVIGNLGAMIYETGDYEGALAMHKESLRMLLEANHKRYIANTYNNIAVTYREMGEYDSTLYYIQKTLEMDIESGFKRGIAMDYEMMGSVNLLKGSYSQAKEDLLKGVELAEQIGVISRQRSMYYRLFRADSSLGNYQQALTWLNKSYVLRDSIYSEEKGRAMNEMRERYETEKKEQEIDFLTQKSELEQTRNAAIGFSLLSIIGIISLLWARQRTAQKKEYEILEKNKIIAEQELEVSKTEAEYFKKELTNYALHIAHKNEFLNQIKSEMADLRSKVANQEALKHINHMGSKIYQNTSINKEMEEFETHVEQVCEGFFKRLDEKYPDLTDQEKRLAALVRLNLSSKDIASIFSISPKSVDQGRYRLRKKLNLDGSSNLTNYLNVV